tara:strand:+ start:7916 stop:8335 length:420 start_codon:yes stop_codon:yes gene_type:complete
MNTIHVRGRLADNVKVTKTSTGKFVLKGTIADNYGWGKSEDDKNKVNWMNFTRFLTNEPSDKYLARLTKGSYVIVDGRLETSKREVDGKVYNNMEVICSSLESPISNNMTTTNVEPTTTAASTTPEPVAATADTSDVPF